MNLRSWMMLSVLSFAAFACNWTANAKDESAGGGLPDAKADLTYAPAEDEDADKPVRREAVLAGGCFWCVAAVYEQLDGVEKAVAGYAGDEQRLANYKAVSTGATLHAESVKIIYDPRKITYGQLLKVFFTTHDPTTLNRQGADVGPQYRSAVFYASPEQQEVAQAYIEQLDAAKVFDKPIVPTLEPLKQFYPAEDYHQNYVENNPDQPYVQAVAQPKVEKVRKAFKDQVKQDDAGD